MENYVTKSISIFSICSLFLLSGCKSDTDSTPIVDASTPILDSTVPIEEPVVVIPPPTCSVGMVLINKFCIDKYEWPNTKGAFPDFAMNAFDAEDHCKSVSKRLCTHTEWVEACLGKTNQAYGYGPDWVKNNCNDSLTSGYVYPDWSKMGQGPVVWKNYARLLYKGVPSGSKPLCFSQEESDQVYDMIGNVREWVVDPEGTGGYSFESSFWFGTMEGELGCGFRVKEHAPNFASYEVGTRCCAEPK